MATRKKKITTNSVIHQLLLNHSMHHLNSFNHICLDILMTFFYTATSFCAADVKEDEFFQV